MALGDCTDTPRDNEALEEKLETIKVHVNSFIKGSLLSDSLDKCISNLRVVRCILIHETNVFVKL